MLQATARTKAFLAIVFIISFPLLSYCQTNDTTGATLLTSVTSCTIPSSGNPNYTLDNATASTGIPLGTCASGTHYDVWFKFVAANTSETVTIGNLGSKITNPEVQILNRGPLTSLACGTTSTTATGLTIGVTYLIRVSNIGSDPSGNGQTPKFDLCLTNPLPPPSNDNCSGATTLTSAITCTTTTGTLDLSTASTSLPSGCESVGSHYDVWYKFVATNNSHTVTISNRGTSFTNPEIQLYSGTSACGSLASLQCGTTSLSSAVLTIGNPYYIRVSNIGSSPATNGDFDICVTNPAPPVLVTAGRMNEVYKQTLLSGSGILQYPWEITYGPDDNLWITESKGYKVYKMNPSTGLKTTVLDISQGSVTSPDISFNCQFANGAGAQGGLAGLALHPQFLDGTTLHDYVYISYIYSAGANSDPNGIFFTNRLVRFTYNTGTGKLESPVSLCDTLPGSSDHNSQRIIIAPVNGTDYLFYAQGDMGAGQFGNRLRPNKAQATNSYEGKILRFNLEPDGNGGVLDKWIPDDNPFNATLGVQSAVWVTGIRNNQGFAYDTSSNNLYGASHGPFSDDEINIIEKGRNYGHPLVIGYAADANGNGTTAGSAPNMSGGSTSSCPMIVSESANATTIGSSYKDPFFSGYPTSPDFPSIPNLWNTTTGGNALWPTETWSGIDIYMNKVIPGWKHSLVTSSLKWGRLVRLKLSTAGTTTLPNNAVSDTITYFQSKNRFRDLAFAPNGKDIYVIMDNNAATSGPGQLNPIVPACPGCVQKYTFLGYYDNAGKSSIPTSIDVTDGAVNSCNTGTTVTIDSDNSNLWVPITGPDGNIMAEIYANGNVLGTVTSSFYKNSGAIRNKNGTHYLDRNMTITPQVQPVTPVKLRLYMSKAEFDALDADGLSGISAITDLKILKNPDACGSGISAAATLITPKYALTHGANGYMLQSDSIAGFSSFYFASSNVILPVRLLTFTGSLQNDKSVLLTWTTENEINTSHFIVERSIDGNNFNSIGRVAASGNSSATLNYALADNDAANQQSLILYYRLRMVDIDGRFTYSSIITIKLADITNNVSVFPNPTRNEATLSVTSVSDMKVKWQLIDNTGRVLINKNAMLRNGVNNITVDLKHYSAGTYFIKLSGENINQITKLQKQ